MYKEYYYFVSGLPALSPEDTKLLLTPLMFLQEAKIHLNEFDFSLLKLLTFPNDISNLVSILSNKDKWFDESSVEKEQWMELIDYLKELGTAKINPQIILKYNVPAYIINYLHDYIVRNEPVTEFILYRELFNLFYDDVSKLDDKFLRSWFKFESDITNILIALNCRKHKIQYNNQLIGNNDLTERLIKSSAGDFGLSKDFPFFDVLARLNETTDIIDKEKGLDALRWKWLDNESFFEYFTLPRLISYFIKLRIIYRWIHLSQSVGEKRFNQVLHDLETSFDFPEEFELKR